MHWKRTLLIIVAIALGTGVLAFSWKVARTAQAPVQDASASAPSSRHLDAPEVTFVDPYKGPKDAKNTIVEFGDYLCAFCQASNQAIDQLLHDRPNDVRFVWKNDPSPLHPGADTAAEAAMCAAKQGAFWNFHDKLFAGQQTYDQISMTVTADNLGLDTAAFSRCLSSHDTQPLVARTLSEAQALGIQALPTFYINGTRYEGELSYDQLLEAISR